MTKERCVALTTRCTGYRNCVVSYQEWEKGMYRRGESNESQEWKKKGVPRRLAHTQRREKNCILESLVQEDTRARREGQDARPAGRTAREAAGGGKV